MREINSKLMKVGNDTSETKISILFLIGVVFLVLILPFLLTRPALFDALVFSNTGQIGDTIGGITAPITGILGALLVYLSFVQQLKANRIQRQALTEEISRNKKERLYNSIIEDIDTLREDINSYQLDDFQVPGTNAINKYKSKFEKYNKTEANAQLMTEPFKNFYFLVASVDDIHKRVYNAQLDTEDINTLNRKLTYLYTSKIAVYLLPIIAHCQILAIDNDIIKSMSNTYDKMKPLVENYNKM